MAGGVEDDPNLKGLSRYFNSQTNRGRANVSWLTHFQKYVKLLIRGHP